MIGLVVPFVLVSSAHAQSSVTLFGLLDVGVSYVSNENGSHKFDPGRLAIAFHDLYLGSMLRWLADPRLKLRREFAATVELFLHGAAAQAKASLKASPKSRKKRS